MSKPTLAIITHSIRMDNHLPLKYFQKFEVKHLYFDAPYGDLSSDDLKNATRWQNYQDLEKKLIKLKPDLIQGAEPYASRIALKICQVTQKAAQKLNKPYIFPVLENRPVNERFGPIIGPIMKKILKSYAQNAALIFALNKGARQNLTEVGIASHKIRSELYGIWGVDTILFQPELKVKSIKYKGQTRKYILFVGRLDEAKGIKYLIEAWNSIKKKFPDIDLVFIGEGELGDDIYGEQIMKLGQMKNSDLPPYFTNALFSVYPSVTLKRWEEQVGMVNLQSLACGTPVITTLSGAIPEYVTAEVGILVPEKDSKALADAMEKMLKNNEFRQDLAKKARPYILQHYDAQKTVEKIEKILLNLIAKE